ncbi:MAG: GNAT family N-acetyltransferase [Bacillota bacterium]|jgi:GNAT superfamily N-acetyltransferase
MNEHQKRTEIYSKLLTEGFWEDPGVCAQMGEIPNGKELFAEQCRFEVEIFERNGLLRGYGNGDGMLIGFSTENLEERPFVKDLQDSSKQLLPDVDPDVMQAIEKNGRKVLAISDPEWQKKFVGDAAVYVIQLIVVRNEVRGTGIFRKLLEPVLEECSRRNLPVVLQTHNPKNIKKYEHFGFKLMEKVSSDEIDLTCCNLLKMPDGAEL